MDSPWDRSSALSCRGAQHGQSLAQCALQQQLIDAEREEPKPFGGVFARPGLVGRDEGSGLAVRVACRDDPVDGAQVLRFLESARNAQEVREIEVTEPERVDAREPSAVSICGITIVRACSAAILARMSPSP
jgi:hypothetical protein